jgi:hypothetical protein
MVKGTVDFRILIRGNGLSFPSCTFTPNETGVQNAAIQSTGHELTCKVHLVAMPTESDAITLATKVLTRALNRMSYRYTVAFESPKITSSQFNPMTPQPDNHIQISTGSYAYVGESLDMISGIQAESLKADLELATMPGERYFMLFRSAMQSEGPVEQFMHLYNILLMFFNDEQNDLDAFIRQEEPMVPQTASPKTKGVMETIYRRLRNEFAHARKGVNIERTKEEMTQRIGGITTLTRRAIELQK